MTPAAGPTPVTESATRSPPTRTKRQHQASSRGRAPISWRSKRQVPSVVRLLKNGNHIEHHYLERRLSQNTTVEINYSGDKLLDKIGSLCAEKGLLHHRRQ